MLGALLGDIIGSVYEWHPVKAMDFPLFSRESRFTDDSVLTAAVADTLDDSPPGETGVFAGRRRARLYAYRYKQAYSRYPDAGFGELFRQWAVSSSLTRLNSYGNGGAMRAVPIGWACATPEEVLREARLSCLYTHRHPEAIKGAQAVALAVFLARSGECKEAIRQRVEKSSGYDLSRSLTSLRPDYVFDSRSGYSVPPSIRAFLESDDYESAVRGAVSLGGDSDTMACIAGGIAHAFYGHIPREIVSRGTPVLSSGIRRTLQEFSRRYAVPW